MKKIFAILTMLMFMVTLGCNKKQDKFSGKWVDGTGTYNQFLDEGNFLLGIQGDGITGKWSILDDGRLKLELFGQTSTYKVSFKDDDTMILVNEGSGETITNKRVKEDGKADSNASADQQTTTEQNKYHMVSAEDVIQISIKTLNEEYRANKFKADSKYKDKLLLITGKIDSIGEDMDNNPTVVLSDPTSQLKTLACKFGSEETPVLANLSVGQTITVAGYCGEGLFGPSLFNTVVQ